MRKTIMIMVALAFMVVAYGSVASGANSTTNTGEIRLLGSNGCGLMFGFRGFAPGTPARIEVQFLGNVRTTTFRLNDPMQLKGVFLPPLMPKQPHPLTFEVDYTVTTPDVTLSGTTTVMCLCHFSQGGGGGSGSGGGTGATTASAASAVTSQPGFAG